jgi:hypothetical protein
MNVATAEGKSYQFHVRITAPPFGDLSGVNNLVWRETVHQTKRLTEAWAESPPTEIQKAVNVLTLAIISLAGFGKRLERSKNGENEGVPAGYQLSFLHALQDTLHYMVPILLFPRCSTPCHTTQSSPSARPIRSISARDHPRPKGKAISGHYHSDKQSRGNLLTAVVRASMVSDLEQSPKESSRSSGERKQGFTEDETMGNVFIYLLAGPSAQNLKQALY